MVEAQMWPGEGKGGQWSSGGVSFTVHNIIEIFAALDKDLNSQCGPW